MQLAPVCPQAETLFPFSQVEPFQHPLQQEPLRHFPVPPPHEVPFMVSGCHSQAPSTQRSSVHSFPSLQSTQAFPPVPHMKGVIGPRRKQAVSP